MSGLRKHEPYPIEKMDENFPLYTICENLRQTWQILNKLNIDEEDEKVKAIRFRIREAITMAKAMDKKLRKYAGGYSLEFFNTKEELRWQEIFL